MKNKSWICLLGTALFITGCDRTTQLAIAQEGHSDIHYVEFGFNVAYLTEAHKFNAALDTLKKDGFKHIRAFEPFSPKLKPGSSNQLESIRSITDREMTLLLSLSNFPYKDLEASTQPSKISVKKPDLHQRMVKYTNRYAPNNMSSYSASIRKMMNRIDNAGLMSSLEFELGNEPDAPRYYWGSPSQWKVITDTLMEILSEYDRPIYCCGFTSSFAHGQKEQLAYLEYLKNDTTISDAGLTYHAYLHNGKGDLDLSRAPSVPLRTRNMLTEYGHITYYKKGYEEKIHTDKYLFHLMELLDYCANNGINRVYFFPLMDNLKHRTRHGLFDVEGKPKISYEMVRVLNGVISDGYRIHKTKKSLIVVGSSQMLVWAVNDISDLKRHLNKSYGEELSVYGSLEKGHWKVLQK